MAKRINNQNRKVRKSSCGSIKARKSAKKNQCTALILLDSEVVRKKYISQCKRAQTTYQKAKKELDVYEKRDKPAFNQWLHAELGSELTALRQVQHALRGKEALCNRIVFTSNFSGCSYQECYRRIKNGEPEMDGYHQSDNEGEDDNNHFGEDAEDFFKDFAECFRDFFFNHDDDEYDDGEAWQKEGHGHPEVPAANNDKRRKLKAVYRDICRRLHPDADGANTAEEMEVWHQVQEAYKQENMDRLEFLRAKIDIAQNGINRATPVGHIQQITEEYKVARASLRSMIRRARQEADWAFHKWSDARKILILDNHRRYLQEEEAKAHEQLKGFDDFLEELDKLARIEEEKRSHVNRHFRNQPKPRQTKRKPSQGKHRKDNPANYQHEDAQMKFHFM